MDDPRQRALAELPVASTSFTNDAGFSFPGGDADLTFEFERDGTHVKGGLRFHDARAFRFRAESICTVWHIDAYDTLVEVDDSPWVAELQAVEPPEFTDLWVKRHFLIYVDSTGAYEVIAASWSWLPEQISGGAAPTP